MLLHDVMLQNNPGQSNTSQNRAIGQTVKRKTLSMAQQVIMDAERTKAIDLYRKMKNKNKPPSFT